VGLVPRWSEKGGDSSLNREIGWVLNFSLHARGGKNSGVRGKLGGWLNQGGMA